MKRINRTHDKGVVFLCPHAARQDLDQRIEVVQTHPERIQGGFAQGATGSGERCKRTFSRVAVPFVFTLGRLVKEAYKVENEAEYFRDEESAMDGRGGGLWGTIGSEELGNGERGFGGFGD